MAILRSIFTIMNRVSAIRLNVYRRKFLLYDVMPAEMRGSHRENRDPQNIADSRKDCGSFVDEKLRALRRISRNKTKITIWYYKAILSLCERWGGRVNISNAL